MSYTPTEWKTGDVITEEKLNHIEEGIGDGGLPKNTFNSIKPGTAMVFDGNEWIQQEGYAYIEKTQEDIVWDGDTNGRDSFDVGGVTLYKISDLVPEPRELIGCVFTVNDKTITITSDMINSDTPGVIIIGEGSVMVFSETSISSEGTTIEVPSTGIYSAIPCAFSLPKIVHKFDSELIESSGQNNVEFVKLVTLSMQAYAESPEVGTGGLLPDGKTLGDIIGDKTVIGLTSKFRYNRSGENTNFSDYKLPVQTCLSKGGPKALWELPSLMMDKSVGVQVDWGYLFYPGSQVSSFSGELDVYAICI